MTWKCHTSVAPGSDHAALLAAGSSHGHGKLSYSFGHLTRSEVEAGLLDGEGIEMEWLSNTNQVTMKDPCPF